MNQPLVTILIPNYKTLNLTKLCLRLIRHHTDLSLAKVIVIDNDSQDDSVDYLRSVRWIQLIERQAQAGESGAEAHSRALDLALAEVKTPYVLSIHTDTLIKNSHWLAYLLAQIQARSSIAGVGSWKLEVKTRWRHGLKQAERFIQSNFYRLIGRAQHLIEGLGSNYYYLRSHCALYRMDLIRAHALTFSAGDCVAGKLMHKQLVELGFEMVFLPSEQLSQLMDHVNHATSVLHPTLSGHQHKLAKNQRRVTKALEKIQSEVILMDNSLDY